MIGNLSSCQHGRPWTSGLIPPYRNGHQNSQKWSNHTMTRYLYSGPLPYLVAFCCGLTFFYFLSYQVPKEIGRVGNESPTFIEPIEHRKDGIQAMFSKQLDAKSSALKRERSPSPLDVTDKKVKMEDVSIGISIDRSESKPTSPSKVGVLKPYPICTLRLAAEEAHERWSNKV
jgi:hypothetical protein